MHDPVPLAPLASHIRSGQEARAPCDVESNPHADRERTGRISQFNDLGQVAPPLFAFRHGRLSQIATQAGNRLAAPRGAVVRFGIHQREVAA